RTDHTSSDLRCPRDRRLLPCMSRQQLKGLVRHRDRAESFRQNQSESHLLRARDRHAKIVAQERAQILVMNPPNDQPGKTKLLSFRKRLSRQKRPSNHDFALHIGGPRLRPPTSPTGFLLATTGSP